MKKYLYALIFSASVLVKASGNSPDGFQNLQPGFIENKGQVKDQFGNVNHEVKFIYAGKNFNLELKSNGFSYEFFKGSDSKKNTLESNLETKPVESGDSAFDDMQISSSRADIILRNRNKNLSITGSEECSCYYNYYTSSISSSQFTFVRCFQKVTYQNAYKGIDMVFTVSDLGELEYAFVVHPGAKVSDIQLEYLGGTAITQNSSKEVVIKTELGEVSESNLHCLLLPTEKEIPCAVSIRKNTVSFNVSGNFKDTLLIDPNIVWGTYYGGENIEQVNCEIALDNAGKIVICGTTYSQSSIATTGAYQTTIAGLCDGLIAKFGTDGKIMWGTYFGGTNNDIPKGIATDNKNNILITGQTRSDANIATAGAYQQQYKGSEDGFVSKFNTSGLLQWSTYLGGNSEDDLRNIVCDQSRNVIVTGLTQSATGLSTAGAYQEVHGGSDDFLITKFSETGSLVWSTYYGGPGSDRGQGITADLMGNIVVCGSTESLTGIASPGAYQEVYGGGTSDAAIAEFSPDGQRLWGSYYGGERDDHGRTPITDSSRNIYFVGFTTSLTNIASPGAHQQQWTASGGIPANDGIIVKMTPTGHRAWGTYFGGTKSDELYSIAIGQNNQLYACGSTRSQDSIASPDAFQPELTTLSMDGLLVILDSAGTKIWGSYLGEHGDETIQDITSRQNQFMYFVMNTDGIIPVSPWVSQTQYNAQGDLAVYKFYRGTKCYDYNEPNGSFGLSKQMIPAVDSNSAGYNGSISSPTDLDFFRVKIIPALPNFKIQLSDLSVNYDLKLFDPQGLLVAQSQNPGTDPETIILNAAPKKKYYISISHDGSTFDSLSCYKLLFFTSATPFKTSNEINGEEGEVKITVTPLPASTSLTVSVTLKNPTNSPNAHITIYNNFLQPVLTKDISLDAGKSSVDIKLPSLPNGLYILEYNDDNIISRKKILIIQ